MFHELGACSFCRIWWLRPLGSGKGKRTRKDHPVSFSPCPLSYGGRAVRRLQRGCRGLRKLCTKQQDRRWEKRFTLKHGNGAGDTGQCQQITWREGGFHNCGARSSGVCRFSASVVSVLPRSYRLADWKNKMQDASDGAEMYGP